MITPDAALNAQTGLVTFATEQTPTALRYTYNTDAVSSAIPELDVTLEIGAYTVAYAPGAYGTGDAQTATKTRGVDMTLPGAIFTRAHYTHTGCAETDGGNKAYDLQGAYATDRL